MKVNTSRFHKRFNTQHNNNLKNVARVFPFILGVKYKTLHIKPCLGWVGNSTEKNNLHKVWSIEPYRFANKYYNSLNSNFTNKHTLSSLNLDSKFWSWFANTLQIEVLIHLVSKVLKPNITYELNWKSSFWIGWREIF